MRFKKIDEYRKGQTEASKRKKEVTEKVTEKQTALSKVVEEYEQEVEKGVTSGKPDEKKLTELEDKIAQLEKEVKRAVTEKQIADVKIGQDVTKDDVLNAWNDEFSPEFKKKKLDPALEKMRAAKLAYIDAAMEYHEILYESQRVDVYTEIGNETKYGNSHEWKVNPLNFTRKDHTNYYYLSGQDIENLQKGVKPNLDEGQAFE